jgi:predicted DNA-binding transcriptional regulator YafY
MTITCSIDIPLTELEFDYKNYRNENSHRQVEVISIQFKSTEYHPESQWILFAFDFHKNETREFAMKDMSNVRSKTNI